MCNIQMVERRSSSLSGHGNSEVQRRSASGDISGYETKVDPESGSTVLCGEVVTRSVSEPVNAGTGDTVEICLSPPPEQPCSSHLMGHESATSSSAAFDRGLESKYAEDVEDVLEDMFQQVPGSVANIFISAWSHCFINILMDKTKNANVSFYSCSTSPGKCYVNAVLVIYDVDCKQLLIGKSSLNVRIRNTTQ